MKKVVIWGTGNTTKKFLQKFDWEKNEVVAFVDNDSKKVGTKYKVNQNDGSILSVEIVSPKTLVEELEYDVIIVSSIYEQEIICQCKEMGIRGLIFGSTDMSHIINVCRNDFREEYLLESIQKNIGISNELMWRNIFVDTLNGYEWWKDTSLSLGRMAVGYNYAYVMCRVLNDFKPKAILELGLGQSSKIISNYVNYYNDILYEIVEHDKSWIEFFADNHKVDRLNIYHRNLVEETHGDLKYHYDDIESVIKDKKYNLISIDGPFGGGTEVSRVDLVPYITEILEEDFVIIIDDYERIGEKNMSVKLMNKLKEAKIKFHRGRYSGAKDVLVIVSEKWKFLTSL